jgi:hypothetical protein
MRTNKTPIVLGVLCALTASATAKDFVYAGRTMSCAEAAAYRDKTLFAEYVSAVDNFDAKRENRIAAVVKEMETHIATLTKDMHGMDSELRKRLAVVVAGLAMSYVGRHLATSGKPNLSPIEKKTLEGLADRATDWRAMFLKYATDKTYKPAAMDVVAVPIGFVAGFFPAADIVWKTGTSTIDVGTALAEHHIAKKDAKLSVEILRAGVKNIVTKMRMPKIQEILAIKDAIDTQCAR